MVDRLVRSPKAATKEHALESERSNGEAESICGRVVVREWGMTELWVRHDISRQTGYNTVARYEHAGWPGLEEGSRAPVGHPNQTQPEIEQPIIELRHAHRWASCCAV